MAGKRLSELAAAVNGELNGIDVVIAKARDLIYVSDRRKLDEADGGPGTALLHSFPNVKGKKPFILVKNGKLAFAKILSIVHPRVPAAKGINPTAIVDPSAILGEGVSIGPYAIIGKRITIGRNVEIAAFAFIGDDVKIGDDSILHPRVTVLSGIEIGKRCVLYEGAVIGSQGFGFATDDSGKHNALRHIGTVILGDDVEVGANSSVDRGTLGATRIGEGTKIDNLVQIGHNCDIGANCLIAGVVAIAGSVVLGKGTTVGGLVGVKDHVVIGDGVMIAGGSNVWGNIPAHSIYSGRPARPHKEELKLHAFMNRLPELFKKKTKR